MENPVFLELRRRWWEVFYYRTANGLEVDFLCRKGGEPMRLIQVAWEMETDDTRKREFRSLAKAMTELDMKDAIIVTHEEEGETPVNGGTVRILPTWRFLLGMT